MTVYYTPEQMEKRMLDAECEIARLKGQSSVIVPAVGLILGIAIAALLTAITS